MANIQKRPDGRWRARYRDSHGKEHARHFARKVDGQAWLDGVTTAVQTGTYIDPAKGQITVGEWAVRWLAAQGHLAPSARARYEGIVTKHVLPQWQTVLLIDLSPAEVAAWITDIAAAGLAPATVRYIHRVFSLMLDLAVQDGRVARNAARGVRLPKLVKTEKRFLTHDQVRALADAAGPYRMVVLLLAYCGLRWGELAALRVGRVDLMRRRVTVAEALTEVRGRLVWGMPKSHQVRSVPIPRFLVDELMAHLAGRDPDALVFLGPRGGVLRNLNFRRDVFDAAAAAAGLGGLTPHELRHTAASLAVSAGANVKAVQRMLGHASAAMTLDVYSGLFDGDLDGVAAAMDAAWTNAVQTSAQTTAQDHADSLRTNGQLIKFELTKQMAAGQANQGL